MIVRRKETLDSKHGLTHRNRLYRSRMNVYEVDDESSVITVEPEKGESPPSHTPAGDSDDTQSASESSVTTFHKVGPRSIKVDYILKLDLGLLVSKKAVKECLRKRLAEFPNKAFELVNKLESSETTKEDGKVFGEELMKLVKGREKGTEKAKAVNSFIAKNKALGELVQKHSFIAPVLRAIVENKLRSVAKVEGEAESLGEMEGMAIGSSLAISLATTLFATIGVDEWILQFPALQEIDKEHSWFRLMVEAVSFILIGDVGWGLKMRVAIGAAMSWSDLMTDIFVSYMYWEQGRDAYFEAIMTMLGVSISLQFVVVYMNNMNRGARTVIMEFLPIIFGFKPALDAYRVAHGDKIGQNQAFDAKSEMAYIKGVELFAECIPGVIIQLMAIATSDRDSRGTRTTSRAAWISLFVSALSTGFVGSSISYDYDTDPLKRKQGPEFYGYVPNKARYRTLVFCSMILFSSGMLLIRCMTIVLLGLIGMRWVLLYLSLDLGLYFIFKAARQDFWYWLPVGGHMEIINSIFARVVVKGINDFTSIIQFRHPFELGGLGWTSGFVLTMASLPLAIMFYDGQGGNKDVVRDAWGAAQLTIPATLGIFAIFFCSIERRYLPTFFSFETGRDMVCGAFKAAQDDETRSAWTFEVSKHLWEPIKGDVKKWVEDNWAKWEEESPKWLDETMKARVPKEFIPVNNLKRASSFTGRSGRRSHSSKTVQRQEHGQRANQS